MEIFNFLIGNIYGWVILGAPIYFIFYLLKKYFKKLPDPWIPVAILIIPALIFGSSVDRITFDKKVRKIMKEHPYLKTYEISYWGAIYEPLTWFNNYIGYVRLVAPGEVLMGGNYHFNLYFRQDMKPMKNNSIGETYQDAHSANCEEKKIYVSIVDSEGKMRMDSSQDFKMSEKDFKFYCLDDWSKFNTAYRKFKLSQ